LIHLSGRELDAAFFAHSAGHVAIEGTDQRADVRFDLLYFQVRNEKPHATVDIVTNTSGRNDARRVAGGSHAADGETIALVNVRHGQGVADDARQSGCVDQLLQRAVAQGRFQQFLISVDASRHTHILTVFFWNLI